MKVCMVARDTSPSNAFRLVAEKLTKQKIVAYLGDGSPIKISVDAIAKSARESDVLLCGMSSSPDLAKEEISAINAAYSATVPIVLYADTYGAVKRKWFESVRRRADAVLTVSDKESEKVLSLFPNAKAVLSGNPLVESAHFPKTTREEIRKRFNIRDDEKIILSGGYKFPAITLPTMLAIFDAAAWLRIQKPDIRLFVFFALHSGDEAWMSNKNFYSDIHKHFLERKEVTDLDNLRVKVTCAKAENFEDKISTAELLPAADLVVTTLSTVDQEAACQRIPVINYLPNIALDRMQKNFGTRNWEACEQRIAEKVTCADDLGLAIREYLVDGVPNNMKEAQQLHYPKPEKIGYAVDIIIQTLLYYGDF